MSRRVRARSHRGRIGGSAGLCLVIAVGVGVVGGCAAQRSPETAVFAAEHAEQPLLTRAYGYVEPALTGAGELIEPVVDGTVAVVRPVVEGAADMGKGLANLVFLDGGGTASGRTQAQLAAGGGDPNLAGSIVALVNVVLPK